MESFRQGLADAHDKAVLAGDWQRAHELLLMLMRLDQQARKE